MVINFVHSCNITIWQANNSKSKKKSLEKYITPIPWLIFMNVLYCFDEFSISRNTDELRRWYDGSENFTHPQVSINSHEISSHSSLVSTKETNVSIVKLLRFGFKYETRLVIYTITKNIIYHLVDKNHLIYNGYLWNIVEK